MAEKIKKKTSNKSKSQAPHKLSMIVTIVNKKKGDFYCDVLQENEVNITLMLMGNGTANPTLLSTLTAIDREKSVIFGVCRQDKIKEILGILNEKFESVKGGKGIAFVVPMSSVIGVSSYKFLANKER